MFILFVNLKRFLIFFLSFYTSNRAACGCDAGRVGRRIVYVVWGLQSVASPSRINAS